MKLIQSLSLAALAIALTASASAFPYANPTYTAVTPSAPQSLASIKGGGLQGGVSTERTTIAVYTKAAPAKAQHAAK